MPFELLYSDIDLRLSEADTAWVVLLSRELYGCREDEIRLALFRRHPYRVLRAVVLEVDGRDIAVIPPRVLAVPDRNRTEKP